MVGELGPGLTLALTSETLWAAARLTAPLIGATTLVGLIISILQGITQVQESSLSFVPKLITAGVVLLALGGWMLRVLTDYATAMIASIPNYF
jgi:flagellar biosynthetic protein FliQ